MLGNTVSLKQSPGRLLGASTKTHACQCTWQGDEECALALSFIVCMPA